ncbi:MAG: TolB family protein [Burkholderiales bacterium]
MLAIAFLTLQAAAAPAAPPATDIYLADLRVAQGRVSVGAPVNVTARPGYDNQPFFLPDGRAFLYTSIREDSQADIYRYDIDRTTSVQVTRTPESEYSPTPLPDRAGFSVVRVEADSTQRLWAFDLDGSRPRLVLDSIKPVGYHAWADSHTLVLFVLGTPSTLQIADASKPGARGQVVASDIGRSLQRIPGDGLVGFLQRDSVAGPWLEQVDIRTQRVTRLVKAPERADFFVWTPDGIVLAAGGTKLYQWDRRRGGAWEVIADLAAAGLTNVTRLAVSPKGDRLAIVAVPADR